MSRSAQILVKADSNLRELVTELERVLGIRFRDTSDEWDTRFEANDGDAHLFVLVNELENDHGIDFEAYNYYVDVVTPRGALEEETDQRRVGCARSIYEQLASTRKFELMLVDDVQTLLARYRPGDSERATT